MRRVILAAALCCTLAACGRSDAPGVYLSTADRRITMIQLARTPDGVVRRRREDVSIGRGGIVSDQSTPLDETTAKRDLLELKPRRATLQDFQSAMTRLQSKAAAERRQAADAQAIQAEHAAHSASIGDAADKAARLEAATVELRAGADKLNAGVDSAPDFGRQSADNTERAAKLAPGPAAAASANQLINDTNRIAVARSQYAASLNPTVQQGAPLAAEVLEFCGSAQGQTFVRQCAPATTVATDFQSAVVRGVTVFNGYKHAIQDDLARQNKLLQKMGG